MSRPIDYDPAFHPSKLVEFMSSGMTNIEVCAAFDISESNFYRWIKLYPEFKEAYETGLPKCEVEAVIKPLKKMIVEGHDKGLKALNQLSQNKFGYNKQTPGIVNNTQVNIGSIAVNTKEEYDKLAAQVKDELVGLNIIDAEFLIEHKKDE